MSDGASTGTPAEAPEVLSPLKRELHAIYAEEKALEARKRAIYLASLQAPESEKACPDYLSEMVTENSPCRKIEYPFTVHGITVGTSEAIERVLMGGKIGDFVSIRPCDKECAGKTYLGILIGDVAQGVSIQFHELTGILIADLGHHNPGIWVPELGRIVYGCESWWGEIKGPDDLQKITDASTASLWYVQLARAHFGMEPVKLDTPEPAAQEVPAPATEGAVPTTERGTL